MPTIEAIRKSIDEQYAESRSLAEKLGATLTNIKYAAFASEETNCFQAKIKIGGKVVAECHNSGHGGCTDIHPVKDYSGDIQGLYALENWVDEEVDKYVNEKAVSKMMSSAKSKLRKQGYKSMAYSLKAGSLEYIAFGHTDGEKIKASLIKNKVESWEIITL